MANSANPGGAIAASITLLSHAYVEKTLVVLALMKIYESNEEITKNLHLMTEALNSIITVLF